jgi:hypothetical protein
MSAAASDAQDGKKQKKEKKQGEARFQDDEKRDEFVRLARATPKGQLKNFSKPDVPGFYPFADNYYPEAVESAWDTYWEKEGFFKPAMQVRLCVRVRARGAPLRAAAAASGGDERRATSTLPSCVPLEERRRSLHGG